MKKIILQTLLILLISLLGILSVFITKVEASQASVSAGGVNAGQDLNVTLNIPANAVAAQADITVKFSDGRTKTGKIAYMNGLSSNSVAISTKDMASGAATITASNIVISDSSGKAIESGGSTSASVNIGGGEASNSTPAAAPSTTPDSSSSAPQTPAKTSSTTSSKPEVKNPSFKDINETVYATVGVNVRSSCSTGTQDNIVGGLVAGQEVIRTGNAEGWSRIKYNGSTAYVASRLLTTTKPETPEEEETPEEAETTEEKSELDTLKEKIGVLPEVGNNVATTMYIVITIISIIICAFVMIYLFKKDV